MAAFLSRSSFLPAALALAGAIALDAGPARAASQYVVIAVEGPVAEAFPPGRVLVPGDRIDLPGNSTLTLLGEDGTVTAIPGPASVGVTEDAIEQAEDDTKAAEQQQKNRSTLAKIASLISSENRGSDSLGVSRAITSDSEAGGLDDPWVLSISRSAQGCIRDEPIRLGRNSVKADLSLVVKGDDVDTVTELDWKAGQSVIALPDRIPPTTNELLVKIGSRTIFIDLNLLPGSVSADDPMAVLGWMVDEGCDGQALAFARLLAAEAGNQ